MQYSTSHAVYYICSKLYACSSRLIFGVYMKHYKHYLVQVQDTFPLKVYGPNNCMVLGPLPPHPHIPNPFCALLAGWGLAGSGQQSKLSRLRSSPNFKCTLRPHPFYRGALFVLALREAGDKMKMRMKMKM